MAIKEMKINIDIKKGSLYNILKSFKTTKISVAKTGEGCPFGQPFLRNKSILMKQKEEMKWHWQKSP